MNLSKVFIHPQSLVDSGAQVGAGTRIWAFAHIAKGAQIGEECNLCDHTFIECNVVVGNRVTIKCGVFLWDGIKVEDDVFIGPNASFTNDLYPRSKQYPAQFTKTLLRQGCSIGANSTIIAGVTIGRWSMIGAGAVVTRDVPDYSLVIGNPARFRAWVCRCGRKLVFTNDQFVRCDCGQAFQLGKNGKKEECIQEINERGYINSTNEC